MKSAPMHLPSTRAELEKLASDAKSALWARYSAAPYKRQIRALWYYIQCERYNVSIAKKHITMFRKYMDNPDACLTRVYKNKYHLTPGAKIIKTFRGVEFVVMVGDRGEFVYNGKSFKSLSVVDRIQKGIVGVSGVHIQRSMRCVFPRGHLHRQRTNQRSHGLVLISMALRF